MAPSFTISAAILGLAAVASAGFEKNSKTNVAVYWGQGPGQLNLVETCKNADVDIVNIAFINAFPDNSPAHYPGSNFGNQCWADTYTVNNVSTKLYSHCNAIGPDITTCQQVYGKTVMLSIGGAVPGTYYLESDDSASYFANFLWQAFGPVQTGYTGPRPFGDAVVDGFDFDIESNFAVVPKDSNGNDITDYRSRGYASMVGYLRQHYTEDDSKHYYVSGAPQCYLPEQWLGPAITHAHFDWLFVQFYNNPSCSARAAFTGGDINFSNWNALSSGNDHVKILLGLPAAEAAAAATYYLTQAEAYTIIKRVAQYSRFGGVGLWESTYSQQNTLCGKEYASWMKTFVNAVADGITIPSNFASCPTVSSSAVLSSSTSKAVSSSSAVVSSSAAGSSSAVVSSSAAAASSSAVVSSSAAVSSTKAALSSAASGSLISSAVSASCLSKPSNVHTKSRTRAPHSIRRCEGSSGSACASATAHASKSHASKSHASKSACASGHKSRSKASKSASATGHSKSKSACSSGHGKSRGHKSASITASSSAAAAQSSATITSYTVTDITTIYTTYCPGTTTITTGGSTLTSTYDSTTVITTTIRTTVPCSTPAVTSSAAPKSSSAAAQSSAVVESSAPVYQSSSQAAVVSSAPVYESSSQAAVMSSAPATDYTVTAITTVYTTWCPGTSTVTTSGSTYTTTYDSTTVVTSTILTTVPCTTSTAPAYKSSSQAMVVSSAPVQSSSQAAVSSAAASSYTVTAITTVYTTYCPGTSTVTTSGTTYTKTYDSSTVVTTTILTTVPCTTTTGGSSNAAVPSSGAGKDSTQAVWTTSTPGGYQGASSATPVVGGSSTAAAVPSSGMPGKPSAPSASTIYVVPVAASSTVAKWTGTASSTSRPATYTGAAIKPVVGMGMLPVVFGAVAFLF